jgi:type IV fimbrial biogenesis protein FimT
LVTITPLGADRITFNGMGWLATNNNGSPTITRIDVASTMVGTEIRALRVTVGAGGVMKMCDPAVAAGDPRACT